MHYHPNSGGWTVPASGKNNGQIRSGSSEIFLNTFGVDRENGRKVSGGWMRGVDQAGDLHKFEKMEGVDVRGGEHTLVAVAAKAVKDIGGGHWRRRTRERNIWVETEGRRREASLVSEA